jgi:nicotinamide mononucleotide transporter
MSPLEIVAVVFGVVSVWMTVRENIWCWPTAIVNVGLFIVVFWEAKLYADMGLQIVYVVLSLYGWWEWLFGGKGRTPLPVSFASEKVRLFSLVAGLAGTLVLGQFLSESTDAALPWWDAGTASFSLVAQFLMTRKLIENWLLWIAVDVVYIPMYVAKGLYPTALLYVAFLGLAIAGWFSWKRSLVAAPSA